MAYPAPPGQQQYYAAPPPGYPQQQLPPAYAQGVPVASSYPPQAYANAGGYPPNAGGYPGSAAGAGQQQQPQTIIVMEQPQPNYMVMPQGWGYNPVSCVCPQCHAQVVTTVTSSPGAMAWISGCILAFIFLPLACIPCCIESCQDVTHSCPSCGWVIRRRAAGDDQW